LVLGAAGVAVGLPLSGLVEVARLPAAAAVLVPASLVAPVTALLLVAFSDDKIAAMAVAKGANLLLTLPLAGWFVDGPWQLAFGVLPTYWPVKALWEAAAGRSPWPHAGVGTVHLLVLGAWRARRFALRLGRPSWPGAGLAGRDLTPLRSGARACRRPPCQPCRQEDRPHQQGRAERHVDRRRHRAGGVAQGRLDEHGQGEQQRR